MARRRAGPEIRGHLRGQRGGYLCQDNKEVRTISEGKASLLKTKRGGRQAAGEAEPGCAWLGRVLELGPVAEGFKQGSTVVRFADQPMRPWSEEQILRIDVDKGDQRGATTGHPGQSQDVSEESDGGCVGHLGHRLHLTSGPQNQW